jgi:pyruvate,water dikinase
VSGRYVLFKPLAENFTEPVTPLSANMFIDFLPIMKLIRGRAYMDLKQIRPLIPFKVTDEEIARLAYLSGNREFTARLSLRKLPLFLLIMLVNYLISGVLYARTRRMPDDFMDSFRDRADLISGDPSVDARNSVFKLFAGTKFFEPVGNMALLINLTSSRYFVLMAVLKKILRRWLPELRRDAESLLCSGTEGILSTEMGRNIAELAIEAKRSPLVSRIIREDSAEEALHQLQRDQGAIPFMQQLSSFQAKHGHRALKEFELQSTRWEEDPSHVIGMIRNYLLVDSDPKELEDKARRTRLDLEDEIRETLLTFPLEKQLGIRWKLIDHIRNRAKYFIKLRENSRFYHIMGFFVVRKKILQIESELLSAGKLKCKDDVFYLRWHEVIDLSEGTLSWPDVEERIRQRRVEYIRQSKLMPPKTIGFDIAAGETAHDTSDPRALSGQGASPGYYEGYARVILDPAVDMELEPGEILVAPYTDPAWTPLFLTAHGAVVEVGSYLSHAGTIAREYGMPCIVDVPECTARIKTGDRISVNGTDGTVRLLQSVEAPA